MSTQLLAVLTSWSFEPSIVVGIIAAATLYEVGWQRLKARSQVPIITSWRRWCYYAGLFSVVLALLSPISTFSALFFFMHMIEHTLLLLVAPPLIWLGAPLLPFLWAFPYDQRRALGRLFRPGLPLQRTLHTLTDPRLTLSVFCLDTAIWHLPVLYNVAEGATLVHGVEHSAFFITALLFWWPIVHPSGGRRRLPYGLAILYLFAAKIEMIAIGVLITFAPTPIYTYYTQVPRLWGISALQDQQIGGLIMWVIGAAAILLVVGIVFGCWFSEEGEPDDRPGKLSAHTEKIGVPLQR